MATQRGVLELEALATPQPASRQGRGPQFASRMYAMPVSAIREILKVTEHPEIISFAGGLPAPELFPRNAVTNPRSGRAIRIAAQMLRNATTVCRAIVK